MTKDELVTLITTLFGSDWPHSMRLLRGLQLVEQGQTSKDAARAAGTTEAKLVEILASADPVVAIIGSAAPDEASRRRNMLGQLILAKASEATFEEIFAHELGPSGFSLEDDRVNRTDTDFRMFDKDKRPFCRLNIKFFGSLFRGAQEWVGLASNDCFPLATYKIHAALKKQHEEHLPYVFLVVSVADLTAKTVAAQFTDDELRPLLTLLTSGVERKRDIEDRFAAWTAGSGHRAFVDTKDSIQKSTWYALSARRADNLLRTLLFERVHAMRVPNFSRQFRNAELDMHFSVSADLTPLSRFLAILKEGGVQRLTSMLERGDI